MARRPATISTLGLCAVAASLGIPLAYLVGLLFDRDEPFVSALLGAGTTAAAGAAAVALATSTLRSGPAALNGPPDARARQRGAVLAIALATPVHVALLIVALATGQLYFTVVYGLLAVVMVALGVREWRRAGSARPSSSVEA
jgi:hypothetical protein